MRGPRESTMVFRNSGVKAVPTFIFLKKEEMGQIALPSCKLHNTGARRYPIYLVEYVIHLNVPPVVVNKVRRSYVRTRASDLSGWINEAHPSRPESS